jgi:hypothetical protein
MQEYRMIDYYTVMIIKQRNQLHHELRHCEKLNAVLAVLCAGLSIALLWVWL